MEVAVRVRKNFFLNMRDLSTCKYQQKGSSENLHLFKAYDEPATIRSVFYVLILSISKTSTLAPGHEYQANPQQTKMKSIDRTVHFQMGFAPLNLLLSL